MDQPLDFSVKKESFLKGSGSSASRFNVYSTPSPSNPSPSPPWSSSPSPHEGSMKDGTPRSQGSVSSSGRKKGRPLPEEQKDEAYWERRRKNNEAAKRSRDARREKEEKIAMRAAFLEQENFQLRVELATVKAENTKLRCIQHFLPCK